jgi:MerR family transcriptional regulator, light-induced transcriptional regulator
MSQDEQTLPTGIGAVERDTGLSKDTLRIWERRYGFPQPGRDTNGERVYPADQVARLHLIKRLMDAGHRPGKLLPLGQPELERLAAGAAPRTALTSDQSALLEALRACDTRRLRDALTHELMRQGLQRFVLETVPGINEAVGEAWMRGELAIHEEHLYSEQVQNILRHAISVLPLRGERPRVLLTSLPGEQHSLGLLMVEALLAAEGAECIALGIETPIPDVAHAAAAHAAEVVALSFSAAYPAALAVDGLRELRERVPAAIAIWAGGAGIARTRRTIPGVTLVRALADVIALAAERRSTGHSDRAA